MVGLKQEDIQGEMKKGGAKVAKKPVGSQSEGRKERRTETPEEKEEEGGKASIRFPRLAKQNHPENKHHKKLDLVVGPKKEKPEKRKGKVKRANP